MNTFAAIDFETANQHRSSICSVGVVIVENGHIADRFYELVRPAPNFYCRWATAIHGIAYSDTAERAIPRWRTDENGNTYLDTTEVKVFPEVWAGIADRLQGLPLVAHNSPFDEGCLRAVHEVYDMTYPNYPFHCTLRLARRHFPHLPNHKLHTVAAHLGFPLDAHHHALADAEACAHIALHIFNHEPHEPHEQFKSGKQENRK